MKKLTSILLLFCALTLFAQEEKPEIFIIDSYVTPELPYTLKLLFFTSEPVTSKLLFSGKEFTVSDSLTEDHSFTMPITGMKFDSTTVPFSIEVQTEDGAVSKSESFDIALPADNELQNSDSPSLFMMCCFGGVVFGLPSPSIVLTNNESYFSITKEIPIITFYSSGFNYPVGIIAAEYSHIFNAPSQNFIRIGYKHVIELDFIEYISPGINGFTDFNGFNGISPELAIGWFNVYNAFTVYSKYRFNTNISDSNRNFHEFSVGLYTSFLSFNL
jgi:hypothetical protein